MYSNWYKTAHRCFKIAPEDMKKVLALVDKIITGNRNWTDEELELQQNYPEIIEEMLKKEVA